MENKKKKCSSLEHIEADAISYCQQCKIYMCNKCENIHLKLCPNHCPYNLNKEIDEIFTGICKETNHINELEYFCKTHNKLCCVACISKIKGKGNGQHSDCDICFIEEIKEQKKNKLKENIESLEKLTNTLQQTINEFKIILEKIDKNKETLKLKIQKIFTQLRNSLNEREDQLLNEVDKQFDNLFFNKDIIKNNENLINKINIILEKGKLVNKDWNEEKLSSMVNDCINIESNIEYISKINEKLDKCNSLDMDIRFFPEDNEINNFSEKIKTFGKVDYFYQDWIESNIINSLNDKQKIKKWISQYNKISSKLLYRLTKDGDSLNKYHQLCDNIKNNLVLIQTENNNIFGCYCTWIWDTSGNAINNINDGILFSLTKNQKYTNQNLRIHKGCSSHGPYIYDKFYFEGTMKKCNILSKQFADESGIANIKEVEIFQIFE